MGQDFAFLNLTHREQGGVCFGFITFILENLDAIQYNLSRAKFPSRPPRQYPRTIPGVLRSHLGLLSSLPTELIDEIFEYVIMPDHVARLAAAHPLLGFQGFVRVIRIRTQELKNTTWHNSRVVLVGDYLDRPDDVDGLLTDDLRAEMDKSQQRHISENRERQRDWEENPMSLYEFATYYEPFQENQGSDVGPLKFIELREDKAVRSIPLDERFNCHGADWMRMYSLLARAWPSMPSLETAVLCNFTKRQFVHAGTVRQFQWLDDNSGSASPPRNRDYCKNRAYGIGPPKAKPKGLTIGAAVLFLTVCTNDWSFASPFIRLEDPVGQGPGNVMGRWAGDCLAVVEPDDVEEGMTDISEKVVAMVRRFIEAMTER